MGIVRARHALLLIGSIGLIGLAGCKSTGNSWAFWNSSPAKDPAAVAKSDYPLPPSKSAAPTVVGPSGNRTGAGTPRAAEGSGTSART